MYRYRHVYLSTYFLLFSLDVRCWQVSWPKKDEFSYYKDANEVWCFHSFPLLLLLLFLIATRLLVVLGLYMSFFRTKVANIFLRSQFTVILGHWLGTIVLKFVKKYNVFFSLLKLVEMKAQIQLKPYKATWFLDLNLPHKHTHTHMTGFFHCGFGSWLCFTRKNLYRVT